MDRWISFIVFWNPFRCKIGFVYKGQTSIGSSKIFTAYEGKYYKNVAGKIHGKQNQYAALLGDYFEGYKTTTVSSNFSKSVY